MGEVEDLPEMTGDLGPLVRELWEHGGSLIFAGWAETPNSMQASVYFPDDEARAQKCREVLDTWRARHAR